MGPLATFLFLSCYIVFFGSFVWQNKVFVCVTHYFCFPASVDALETRTIKQVACGQMHTLAVTDNGLVFAWGDNAKGQLGLGNTENTVQSHPKFVITLLNFVFTASENNNNNNNNNNQ